MAERARADRATVPAAEPAGAGPDAGSDDMTPGVLDWIDRRLGAVSLFRREFVDYRVPANLNWLWQTGGWILAALLLLVATGLPLAFAYAPEPDRAFASVVAIEHRIAWGWLIRALHQAGASALFAALYLHVAKSVAYGSFKSPRELVWLTGVALLGLALLTAFLGGVLPWGQTSYWGAVVVARALGDIPVIGPGLAPLVLGGTTIGASALHRAFVGHMLLALACVALVGLHVASLHVVGPNNPAGEPPPRVRAVPFHPVHTGHAVLPLIGFAALLVLLACFAPDLSAPVRNATEADPNRAPGAIAPAWYLVAFYAVLRAVPGGVGVVLVLLVLPLLAALPWLDRTPVARRRLDARARAVARARDAGLACGFALLLASGLARDMPVSLWAARAGIVLWLAAPLGAAPFLVRRAS